MKCEHCEQGGQTYSEAFRHECEVRYICKLDTLEKRRAYLKAIEQNRSKEEADKLRKDVMKEWGKKNG